MNKEHQTNQHKIISKHGVTLKTKKKYKFVFKGTKNFYVFNIKKSSKIFIYNQQHIYKKINYLKKYLEIKEGAVIYT